MMTDPIADMLTRIRNAVRVERPFVDMPASRLKAGLAAALKGEGYVIDYQVGLVSKNEHGVAVFEPEDDLSKPKLVLRVILKYGPQGEKVIQHLERVSRPGCRIYRSYRDLRPVLDGLGVAMLSTSQGVMSDRQARGKRLGGEVLCKVW
jgi:small subunit ribosomal protein S8